MEDHLLLQDYSGKLLWYGSAASEYLQNLPLANVEENCREMDTRYLLPRNSIFTFGLQNVITDRVVFFCCKICQSFIKLREMHMLDKHPKQENNIPPPNQNSNAPPTAPNSKKNSHKSKKKVVLPPSVPPPPLFPKMYFKPPATVNVAPPVEDLLPPVLQPLEVVKTNPPCHYTSPEKIYYEPINSANLPLTLTTQVSAPPLPAVIPLPLSKPKEKSFPKPEKHSKHKRSKRREMNMIQINIGG